jgi:hypothetical protein
MLIDTSSRPTPRTSRDVSRVELAQHTRAITRTTEGPTMTKLNADNTATFSTDLGAKVRNRKSPAKSTAPAFPIVLKTILDDIVRDVPTFTKDTKAMRVVLRTKMKDLHSHNAAWVATSQSEYDAIRSLFDPAYASRIAKPAKVRAPRKAKVAAPAAAE